MSETKAFFGYGYDDNEPLITTVTQIKDYIDSLGGGSGDVGSLKQDIKNIDIHLNNMECSLSREINQAECHTIHHIEKAKDEIIDAVSCIDYPEGCGETEGCGCRHKYVTKRDLDEAVCEIKNHTNESTKAVICHSKQDKEEIISTITERISCSDELMKLGFTNLTDEFNKGKKEIIDAVETDTCGIVISGGDIEE